MEQAKDINIFPKTQHHSVSNKHKQMLVSQHFPKQKKNMAQLIEWPTY